MKMLKFVAYVLLLIGGINWGIIGATDGFNPVDYLLAGTGINRVIYLLVGLSALWAAYSCRGGSCNTDSSCCK